MRQPVSGPRLPNVRPQDVIRDGARRVWCYKNLLKISVGDLSAPDIESRTSTRIRIGWSAGEIFDYRSSSGLSKYLPGGRFS
jgi:hypothetical protein